MTNRRQFIQSVAATGLLLTTVGRAAGANNHAMNQQAQMAMTPDDALQKLIQGNERFVRGRMLQRDLLAQVRATADGQYPFATVVGCIDSRVPPELVFDQGIGDIFSGRIAGNFVNTDLIGSLEFTTKVSGSKLIVVLGHTECGAIRGATDNVQMGNLTHTLSNLLPAVYSVAEPQGGRNSKNKAFVQKVAEANVRLNVEALPARSGALRDLVKQGKLRIVGAMHDIGTGKVTFQT